ncbi:MAG: crotonase [Gammaproteobacteria bacterium]|nr:crotonase [Gammaproteobacteria bacterium]
MSEHYQHWRMDKDEQGIVEVIFDRADSSVNTFNRAVLEELDQLLDTIVADSDCRGVIIHSAKKNGFAAGADINQFTTPKSEEEAFQMIWPAHQVLFKLEELAIPTVAAIHGLCLGGGAELALACRYRVIEQARSTRIGFPEIKLGIHPGWGGMIRGAKLLGGINAMTLILSASLMDSRKACRLGFADEAVEQRYLMMAARTYILSAKRRKKKPPGLLNRLSNGALLRPLIAAKIQRNLVSRVSAQHYPAPYAALEVWKSWGAKLDRCAFEEEAKSVAKLITTPQAQNLVRLFFIKERMNRYAKGSDFSVKRLHVVGAGTMGADIAAWSLYKGIHVTLQDTSDEALSRAFCHIKQVLAGKLKVPRLLNEALDRLTPDREGEGVARADLVIEAIVEKLAVKQALFQQIEARLPAHAVMATNTSSFPLEEIGQGLNEPERLIGLHFFNPVAKMPLVEIIWSENSRADMVEKGLAFAGQLAKQPIKVKSSPGFLVNRCLMPYLVEAVSLYAEGVAPSVIDAGAKAFGMPMGPLELADVVGLDILLDVAENLSQHYRLTIPEQLRQLIAEGRLGNKSGGGFYRSRREKRASESSIKACRYSLIEIGERLILPMLNECGACMREGIIEDAELLDGGMVFGSGFAPFHGGPMHYVNTIGVEKLVTDMKRCAEKYGDHFIPDDYWLSQL